MNTFCYFASIQKSMAITSSVVLCTGSEQRLLVSKKNRVEVFRITVDGLIEEHEVNLYARVLHLTSLKDKDGDLLVIVTKQMKVHLADRSWRHCDTIEIERDLKPLDYSPLFAKDPLERVLCLHIFAATLHAVFVTRGATVTLRPVLSHFFGSFNQKVVDLVFLEKCDVPRVAVLMLDNNMLLLKVFEVTQAAITPLQDWIASISVADSGRLFALETGSLAIATASGLFAFQPSAHEPRKLLDFDFQIITAVAKVDNETWVCTTFDRRLLCLKLRATNAFQVINFGEVTKASCISYLDNAAFYLGSDTDYHMIVRINGETLRVEVVTKNQNLSPVVDMQVMTSEFHSEPEFVLSSCIKPSAVTVMSKDINVQIEAEVEVGKVTGMWPSSKSSSRHFDYLILSYLAETRVQELNDFTLTSVEIPGFDHESSTILAGNLGTALLQVTATSVNLSDGGVSLRGYKPAVQIQQASVCGCHLLVVNADNTVSYLNFANKKLTLDSMWQSPHDISCLVCSEAYAVVGVWFEFTIRIMKLPDLMETWKEQVSLDVLPRSLFLKPMGKEEILFCGLGDGSLLVYTFNEGRIDNQRNLQVGREAVRFSDLGENRVLISSSVPKVAFLPEGQLRLSKFNLDNVQTMCNFANPDIPDCLAAVANNTLLLLKAESIQLISLMRYYPNRIVHFARVLEDNFVLITSDEKKTVRPDGVERSQYFVQVIEKVSELSYQFPLDDDENGVSLLIHGKFIVVGTTSEKLEGGALRVFTFTRRELASVFTDKVDGPPLCMKVQSENTIAIVLGKRISLWTLSEEGTLVEKCRAKRVFSLLVALDCHSDVLVVGDMIKAVALFRVADDELQDVAHFAKVIYVADVALLSHNLILVSEIRGNVFLFRYGGTKMLELTASWNMQEKLSCLRTSVVTPFMSELCMTQVCYYASAEGSVGLIALISEARYKLLSTLQVILSKRVAVFKQVAYADMRELEEFRPKTPGNYVDGDLLQQFLGMSRADQETLAMEIASLLSEPTSVNELQKIISSYSLLH